MMRSLVAVGVVISSVVLLGCREWYSYNLKKYDSAADALLAQSKAHSEFLSGIVASPSPIAGILKVYLPNADRIRETGIAKVEGVKASDDVLSYVITIAERDFDYSGRAIRKRRGFSAITVEKRFETSDPPANVDADYVLWMSLPDPGTSAWYFRRRGQTGRELVPMDTGLSPGVPRTMAFLEAVERLARAGNGVSTTVEGKSMREGSTTTDKLRQLERLHDDGLITDEEYRKARTRALDQL